MTGLLELQRQFRNALLDAEDEAILREIHGGAIAPEGRLQIYRNAALLLLTEALASNFPATCRIVDRRFFAYAAAEFVRGHPPHQPRLAEYGADLPGFLAGFAPASGLPWLPDLARLEWSMLECQEAEEAAALTAADLRARTAEDLPRLGLSRPPACRLMASPHPVDRIREFALAAGGEGAAPALEGDPVRLLIRRTPEGVAVRRLGEDAFRLLERLFAGHRVGEALEGEAGGTAPLLAAAVTDGLFAAPLSKS